MAKRYTILLFFAAISLGLFAQSTDSPAGRWKPVDDETGEVKSIIEIYKQDGGYHGRIADILVTDNKEVVCEKCPGKQQGKPMLGLVIIKNLTLDGEEWNGGTILDPEKGAEYKLSAWYEDNDPNTLYIRGKHWTGLYRTQAWKRE